MIEKNASKNQLRRYPIYLSYLREKQLEEQQKYMEEQRKQHEREMARKSIMKK